MSRRRHGFRGLKKEVKNLLMAQDFNASMRRILSLPPKEVMNPLFSFLLSTEPLVKWRAVSAMGRVVAHLASADMEGARVIVRRLMWQLNDESGGIGWGCPEAMGEILACHKGLAQEYHEILISYVRKDGNFLEHEKLQPGALWGVGRLAQQRPRLARGAEEHIFPFLGAASAETRGTALWALAQIGVIGQKERIIPLTRDHSPLLLYREVNLESTTVAALAAEALATAATP